MHPQQKGALAEGQCYFFTKQGRVHSHLHYHPACLSSLVLLYFYVGPLRWEPRPEQRMATDTVNIRLYALQLYDMSYNWGIFLARGRTRTQYSTVCRRPSRPRASHWSDSADVATQSATIQQPGQLTKCARVSYKRILTVKPGP